MVRRVAGLILATAALVVLIVLLGDVRRASNVLAQSKQKAAAAQVRLNSTTSVTGAIQALQQQNSHTQTGIPFEYLTTGDAYNPANASTAILVAHSPRVHRVFLSDGRGVLLVQGDTFSGRWVTEVEFQELQEAGKALLTSRQAGAE